MILGELGNMPAMNRCHRVGWGIGALTLWVVLGAPMAPGAMAAEEQSAPAQKAPTTPNTPTSQDQAPAQPPVEVPLQPPPMAQEPVRIWQPEGMGDPAPSPRPLPRLVVRPTTLPIQQPGPPSSGSQAPGTLRPEMMRPGGMPPGMMPPGAMRPDMMRPGMMRPGMLPPGALPPGALPPGASQRGAIPPGAMPPGAMPPGAMPPGAMPPGTSPAKPVAKSSTWSPWTSLGLGLLVAGGVTWAVTSSQKRRQGFDTDSADLGGRGDDRFPRG